MLRTNDPRMGSDKPLRDPVAGNETRRDAMPGRGGLVRIGESAMNSMRGLAEGLRTEAAVKQETALAVLGLIVSPMVASNLWTWIALVASLLFVLTVEFLNTAIERLCNHVTPERHEAIRVTKDLASAGVFFALLLAGLVWSAAVLETLGIVG